MRDIRRRQITILAGCVSFSLAILALGRYAAADDVRVVVWDEQQPAQKAAYDNFLGNEIAKHLQGRPGLQVKSVCLADDEQGLSDDVLDNCDVLVWWGHVRQREISVEKGRDIVRRIKAGQLSLLTLHSAHWSRPFIEAMFERSREDALAKLSPEDRAKAELKEIPPRLYSAPKADAPLTPSATYERAVDGHTVVTLKLPNCCFPLYRVKGEPSHFKTLLPEHPIARGVPAKFTIERTEVYGEPFHVPKPDAVVFEERWDAGEWFRNVMIWQLGKAHVVYFRPGHEPYPIFKQEETLRILENAVRWLGGEGE